MKPREIVISVAISFPLGEKYEDWIKIDTFNERVYESDLDNIGIEPRVRWLAKKWLSDHPDLHDCLGSSELADGDWICQICGNDVSLKKRASMVQGELVEAS